MSTISILSLVWIVLAAVLVAVVLRGLVLSFREIFAVIGRGFRAFFRVLFHRASAVKESLSAAVDELEAEENDAGSDLDLVMQDDATVEFVVSEQEKTSDVGVELTEKQKRQLVEIRDAAIAARDKGKYDFFEKKLIEGLAIDPNNIDFLKMLADLYFSIGQMKKATPILKKLIDEDPENHKALWQLAEIHIGKSEFNTAELLLQRVVALKGDNPKYLISMIDVLYNTDRKYDAALLLEKVVKLRPTNISYLMAVGDLYDEIEMRDMAAKFYEKILEIEPTHVKAKQKLQKLWDF